MFKKMFAKLGVGAAKIDFVLDQPEVALGDSLSGEFRITGGSVQQKINRVDVDLVLQLNLKGTAISKVIASIPVSSSFTTQEGENKVIPFTYAVPNDILISSSGISYHLASRLDIAEGVDTSDNDYVQILPPRKFQTIFKAMDAMGFREKPDSGNFNGYSQEFEFFPTGMFRNEVREVEFVAAIEPEGIRLLLEVDLPPSAFGKRELKQEVFFHNAELDSVEQTVNKMQTAIQDMMSNPHAYVSSHKYASYGHGSRHGGGLAGAVGGLAAGMLGGMIIGDLMSGDDEAHSGEEGAGDDASFDFFGDGEDEI
ncbi:sporulation protein [Paenibacillus xerothermodurans]|uniref:Sporulation protein SpoOM n=1 Tax=Paenibacillus xerothermodurans TaxID=1977292 RepID=A0A2W1N723_PAEXE|nr:sporulation protein [Paenibacillus xerothermodurans]PZE19624.1 sporulation protein SpoOM [Paenibacillus xerothermodurans]